MIESVGAVQQRLAAQAVADIASFADRQRRGIRISQLGEVLGVVEQAVG
jgi:hypothetical protein